MENPKPTSDEIDLTQLFAKIGNFFYGIAMGFMRFLALLRRAPRENKLIFIVVTTITVLVGISYSSLFEKKYYESTMIISSDHINKELMENLIKKLNLLAKEESKHGLIKQLKISDTLAYAIVKFDVEPYVDETDEVVGLEVLKEQMKNVTPDAQNEKLIKEVVKRIEIENRHAFEITVRTLNPTAIADLQTALVNYFRSNDYIKNRIAITQFNLVAKQIKLKSDVRKLDSLKSVIYDSYANQLKSSVNVVFKAVSEPAELYKQDASTYEELQQVNEDLYLHKDFEVVDGLTEFSEPASLSLAKEIVISVLLGLVLSYVAVALIGFDKYLAKLN